MAKRTVKLATRQARQRAHALIDAAPEGYVCAVGEETRTQEQNRLMWPLIQDMQEQLPDMTVFSADDMKLRFLHSLGQELRFLPEIEGAGMFPVGQRSSTLSKSQFSGLIDLMFAYGAKRGVRWSQRSEATRDAIAMAAAQPTRREPARPEGQQRGPQGIAQTTQPETPHG